VRGVITTEEKIRVNMGFQCPECSGVQVGTRRNVAGQIAAGLWECQDCGCCWDDRCYSLVEGKPS
jgi:ribosomal protein L37AE/L43A